MSGVKKIIVVEDDRDINNLISYNLQRQGYRVISVYDGPQAQEIFKKELFDVAILDIRLPGIDGFQLCRQIKSNPSCFNTFVIMLTAKTASEDKLYAHILGADNYLAKPFSVQELLRRIKELDCLRQKKNVIVKK